jgi:RNA polymerase sigma-70 factor (ECF subfamily)
MTPQEQDEEQQLIERANAGDINAFETIYRRHCGMAYSVAYRITNNRSDAEETVQDVFTSAHRALKTFNGASTLKTWLYRITVNKALNTARKYSKARHHEQAFDHDMSPDDLPNNTDQQVEHNEARERADALLSRLDPDKRACLTLRAVEGLSYQEISAALGININTVRTRLKRAREFLLTLNTSSSLTGEQP